MGKILDFLNNLLDFHPTNGNTRIFPTPVIPTSNNMTPDYKPPVGVKKPLVPVPDSLATTAIRELKETSLKTYIEFGSNSMDIKVIHKVYDDIECNEDIIYMPNKEMSIDDYSNFIKEIINRHKNIENHVFDDNDDESKDDDLPEASKICKEKIGFSVLEMYANDRKRMEDIRKLTEPEFKIPENKYIAVFKENSKEPLALLDYGDDISQYNHDDIYFIPSCVETKMTKDLFIFNFIGEFSNNFEWNAYTKLMEKIGERYNTIDKMNEINYNESILTELKEIKKLLSK